MHYICIPMKVSGSRSHIHNVVLFFMVIFHFIKQRTTNCSLFRVYPNPLSIVLSSHFKSDYYSLKYKLGERDI